LRIRAADLMTGLCGKRETAKRLHIRQRPYVEIKESLEPDPFPLLMNKAQCPAALHWDKEYLKGKQRAAQRGDLIFYDHPKCQGAVEGGPQVNLRVERTVSYSSGRQ